jgi:hypothetical protein
MFDFEWHDYTVNQQDTGSVFDIADDFEGPVYLGDFIPELELELEVV